MGELFTARERASTNGPALTDHIVVRSRLDDRFRSSSAGIVRLIAPGGYGKSTLMARWVAADPRPVVWLTLQPIDDDALVLSDALLGGFERFGGAGRRVGVGESVGSLPLAGVVRSYEVPFIMVLDDLHHLTSEASAELVATVASNLPTGSTLLLAGRTHAHDEAFARFRLDPGMVDLGVDDLAFDLAETEELLRLMGVEVDLHQLGEIATEFGGWPAGLRLAALASSAPGPSGSEPDLPSGRERFVTDYLEHEWLGRLDADDELLLMELACLDRFTAAMCQEVLGRETCGARVRELRKRLTFLLPLDVRDEWYHLHHLLATLLSARLQERHPARFAAVHAAASLWWERHGDVDLAIEHAARHHDIDRCEELVVQHLGTYVASGHSAVVRRWLQQIPQERVDASPRLQAVWAVGCTQGGDGPAALRWTRRLAETLDRAGDIDERTRTELRCDALRAALEPDPSDELVAAAERAVLGLGGGWRAFAHWGLGGNRFLLGDLAGAREAFEIGAFEAEAAGTHVLRANLLAMAAAVAEFQGRDDEVLELTRSAETVVREHRTSHVPTTGIVAAMSALAATKDGRLEQAREALSLSRRHLEGFVGTASHVHVLANAAAVKACLSLDDVEAARSHVKSIERHSPEAGLPAPVGAYIEDLLSAVDAASERSDGGAPALTEAEMRVLKYLPTNLSLADIAGRLYISRNTVKSHVAAIYRKLGTSSRREAVDLARRSGLLASGPGV